MSDHASTLGGCLGCDQRLNTFSCRPHLAASSPSRARLSGFDCLLLLLLLLLLAPPWRVRGTGIRSSRRRGFRRLGVEHKPENTCLIFIYREGSSGGEGGGGGEATNSDPTPDSTQSIAILTAQGFQSEHVRVGQGWQDQVTVPWPTPNLHSTRLKGLLCVVRCTMTSRD